MRGIKKELSKCMENVDKILNWIKSIFRVEKIGKREKKMEEQIEKQYRVNGERVKRLKTEERK